MHVRNAFLVHFHDYFFTFQKFSDDFFREIKVVKKIAKPQHFHDFFHPKIFDYFSREIKLSTVTCSRFFFPFKNSTIFLVKSKLILWTENEHF